MNRTRDRTEVGEVDGEDGKVDGEVDGKADGVVDGKVDQKVVQYIMLLHTVPIWTLDGAQMSVTG